MTRSHDHPITRWPLLLGHRGARASRQVPENSLESFELCLQHGCDGFEFDVRRSADGVAVICHDPVIRGLEITRTPAAQLALPMLEQVLRRFASRAFLDIELKVPGLEASTIEALHNHPPSKGYVVSSFLPEVLAAIRTLDAGIPLGFLCDKGASLQSYRQLPVEWVIPQLHLADETLIKELHSAKKKVMVWTVNRPNDIERLSHCGVDSIISDDTELLIRTARPNSSPQT